MSPMSCVNLAETSHTHSHRSIINVYLNKDVKPKFQIVKNILKLSKVVRDAFLRILHVKFCV